MLVHYSSQSTAHYSGPCETGRGRIHSNSLKEEPGINTLSCPLGLHHSVAQSTVDMKRIGIWGQEDLGSQTRSPLTPSPWLVILVKTDLWSSVFSSIEWRWTTHASTGSRRKNYGGCDVGRTQLAVAALTQTLEYLYIHNNTDTKTAQIPRLTVCMQPKLQTRH